MANKVKFNIYDVYYAVRTESGGTVTYATPKALAGAVSISLEPQGERTPFYADGIEYYTSTANNGYEGDLELALVPDGFLVDIFDEDVDSKKIQFEIATDEPKTFALSFTVDGDDGPVKFWFYNCVATRPAAASTTNTDTKEPQTESMTITARPEITTAYVRCKSTANTSDTELAAWNNAVYQYTP